MFEPGQDGIARRKAELRRHLRRRREAVVSKDAIAASILAARQAHQLGSFRTARTVALYCTIRGELDPMPWVDSPAAQGKRFVFPRTHVAEHRLSFHLAADTDFPLDASGLRSAMAPGPYGILEPTGPAVALEAIDLMVVPALAYDPRGVRLGYGGGFYDRCLASLPAGSPLVAVGLGYDWQIVPSLPATDHDRSVAHVVTPSGVVHCHHALHDTR